MALPGSPLDNFMDRAREGFREAPGNYYGDAQLAAMQQERIANMGQRACLWGRRLTRLPSTVGATTRILTHAGRIVRRVARLSSVRSAHGSGMGGFTGHAIMTSPVGEPVTWAMWNWGKLDDLVIAPTPALLGYSAVETVWGPWKRVTGGRLRRKRRGCLRQGSATSEMIRQRYNAVLEQSGRVMADEWLVGYQEEQARLNARGEALVPTPAGWWAAAAATIFCVRVRFFRGTWSRCRRPTKP